METHRFFEVATVPKSVEGLEIVAKSLRSPASAADIPSAEENSQQSRVGGGG